MITSICRGQTNEGKHVMTEGYWMEMDSVEKKAWVAVSLSRHLRSRVADRFLQPG